MKIIPDTHLALNHSLTMPTPRINGAYYCISGTSWRNDLLQIDISTCSGFSHKNLAYITQIPKTRSYNLL